MDPETEKRLAALILEEATRLRLQAEKEGVHVYLSKPRARGRPNPQFLQATVRSIEQANRAAEINEMWRRRAMELELERSRDERHRRTRGAGRSDERKDSATLTSSSSGWNNRHKKFIKKSSDGCATKQQDVHLRNSEIHVDYATDQISDNDSEQSYDASDDVRGDGLKDDEVEEFLRSRVKRGRGEIGSRMDEAGPYPLPQQSGRQGLLDIRVDENWEEHAMGPIVRPLVEIGRGQLLELKSHKKKRHKRGNIEDFSEKKSNSQQKLHREKRNDKKHRSSRKASRKKRRKDDRASQES